MKVVSILAELREVIAARELAWMLAAREIRVRYKHTVLGIGWALAVPLCLMLVFTFLFSRVARVSTGSLPYAVFVYLGLVPWQFHASVLTGSARCLTENRNLVTKVYFAREALPLSVVFSALADFAVAALVLVALMAWYAVVPGWGLLLVPLVLAVQVALSIGLAFLFSAGNLLYRDVQYLLQVLVLVWMFASSVVYPIPRTGNLAWLAWLNPMTPILDAYRGLIVGGETWFKPEFGVAALVSLVLLVFGWRWFRGVEGKFGELA